MEDRKVFKFLGTFSRRQLNRFEDYVNSPYFNKSEEICSIYLIAKKFVLSNSNKNYYDYFKSHFSKDKKNITQKNLDKFLSRINLFALDFVGMEKLKEKEFLKNSLVMEYFFEGDELRLFDKIYKKAKNKLNYQKKSFENYRNQFIIEELRATYAGRYNNRNDKHNLQQLTDLLDKYYLSRKFNLEVHKISFKNETNANYQFYFLSELIQLFPKTKFIDDVLVSIWFQICTILFGDGFSDKKEYLKNLQTIIDENIEILNKKMVFNLIIIIQNYARFVYIEDKEYFSFLFNLYKSQIENKSIYLNDKIPAELFNNIVTVCINKNELIWAEQFISTNADKINPGNISFEITNYNLARVNFHKGEYLKTRDVIVNLNFKDVYHKIALKKLELMLYFELKEFYLLESSVNAFRVSLTPERNGVLVASIRNRYKEFINVFTKILRLYQPESGSSRAKALDLRNSLINSNINEKLWLISKLEQLLK